ncbi:MAG: monovalent cation/H(+) antiporter subunit G [Vicinamibacterales bacterium]
MIALLSLLLKATGVIFLVAASLGVVRFSDPLQRMHASTKAGTVGAGFVLVGVACEMSDWNVAFMIAATIVFLLLTIPIAGHLLGRAAYVSGARLEGLQGRDALNGVLERSVTTLDERLRNEQTVRSAH